MRHQRTLISFLLTTVLASTGTFAQTTPQPSYGDTVAWLQGVSASGFVEFKRCEFEHRSQRVEFGKLSTSGINYDRFIRGSDVSRIVANCAKGGACVPRENDGSEIYFAFHYRDAASTDGGRVIAAVRHLIVLCGGTVVPDKLF